ncbi:MAG: tyrosine-type recombinase/integrase, partial [Rhodospirillales bacterium]|nr:tyrosine-type recombinase/integrase [Rhodospirillales bacterium]
MATIRKRGKAWQVQIRLAGCPPVTRTFKRKPLADAWARQQEAEIDRNGLVFNEPNNNITVGELLIRYRDEVLPSKRGQDRECYVIRIFQRHKLSQYSLKHITPDIIREYRDERLTQVKPSTVHRQLGILQHAFAVAIREWGYPLSENPVAAISKPALNNARNRRLQEGELDRLIEGCGGSRVWWLKPSIILAIETGMRRGELLNIHRQDVDLEVRTLHIPITKNGHARTIPLTETACEVLRSSLSDNDRIFPPSANAFRLAWERLKRRVGIEDLRFHDLRHEWVADCYSDSFSGAPVDGGVWRTGDCPGRVIRGGGWFDKPKHIRAAMR